MSNSWKFYNAVPGLNQTIIARGPSSGTVGTLALSSAYSYASSGAAVLFSFFAQESATLTDLWIKVASYSGTWGSTDGHINVEIREGINGNNIPGTTLTGSFTITLDGSTTGWIHASGLSVALTAGKSYSVAIGDADGGATNFVTLDYSYGPSPAGNPVGNQTVTTTNGFSTAGTVHGSAPAAVVKVGTILYAGCGFDTIQTVTTGTYERGMRFQPPENCTLVGIGWTTDSTSFLDGHTYKLYADSSTPGGATLMTFSPPATARSGGSSPTNDVLPLPASSRVDLTAGTWYRLVIAPAVNLTTPRQALISGSPDANVLAAFQPFGGNSMWTQQSGSVWDDSQTAACSLLGPVLVPNHDSAGGSGNSLAFQFGGMSAV